MGSSRGLRALGLCLVLMVLGVAQGATPAEMAAYDAAVRIFQTAAYDVAERELVSFLQSYPSSDKLPEVHLLVGQARYQQRRYEEALALFQDRLSGADGLADEYEFWIAESLFQLGRWADAAQAYSVVVSRHPTSRRRLDASVGEAYAQFRAGQARRTFELLTNPDGAFQQAAWDTPQAELVVRGTLLLAEACLAVDDYAAGERALTGRFAQGLQGELEWRRLYLLARIQANARSWDAAAQTAGGLASQLATQTNAAAVVFRADAQALLGHVLELAGQPAAALHAYETNLAQTTPTVRRSEAAESIARLAFALPQVEEATSLVQGLLARFGSDPVAAPLQLAAGELRLRQYFGLPEDERLSNTTLLGQARQHLALVATNGVAAWAARAQFDLGWCAWEESGGGTNNPSRLPEALNAFDVAATQLPRSLDQAIARFKLADCQQALSNYPAASGNYWVVATNYADLETVRPTLADQALYQAVRTAIRLGDMDGADRAMRLLLEGFPESLLGHRTLLLFGQALGHQGQPVHARSLFSDFLQRFEGAELAPEVRLALARTWQQEGNWAMAVAEYTQWLVLHTNSPVRARADFGRAWCTYKSGDGTNAFQLFNSFLARYPGDPRALSARHWLADYYYREQRFDLAELEYKKIIQDTNWPLTELTFHAQLMAGRSAYFREGYKDARAYFTQLINSNCPPQLLPEAYFELGNTIRKGTEATNVLEGLREAIDAYSRIPRIFPTNAWASLAWGEIGNCHLQLATADGSQYDLAAAAYSNVLSAPLADVASRSQAQIGLGLVFERKASAAAASDRSGWLTEALAQYLGVVEGKNLRAGELASLFWVEKAALACARLAEETQRWQVAEQVCRRVLDLAPASRAMWEARLARLQQTRQEVQTK